MPHVFAAEREGLWFAFGWSQAAGHADLVLRMYGESRGRAAEYWGPGFLTADQWVHRMGIPERSRRWLGELKPEFREMTAAFARGINAYAAEHPDEIDLEVRSVLPVTAEDVLNHFQRVIHFTFVAPVPGVAERLGGPWKVAAADSSSLLTPPSWRGAGGGAPNEARPWNRSPPPGLPSRGGGAGAGSASAGNSPLMREGEAAGSNAWAIAPSRTAEGHAILVANPHLPWSGLFTWHEAHFVTPEINLYGATLVGMPFLTIAFNDHLGWTHTVNTFDGADLYEVELDGDGYRYDGSTRKFAERRYTLKIRDPDGSMRESELVARDTVHGPVIATRPGGAVALRVTGLDSPHILEQYWGMGTAGTLEEFEAAHAMLQMPMFTTIYADRHGRIMHLFGGRTPRRPHGDWAMWQRPVPGSSPDTLWTTTHGYAELPRVADPPTGWLQNANDPPWTTTVPAAIRPDDYPPYMAPAWGGPFVQFRAQRSSKLLMDAKEPMTFEQVVAAKHSTRVESADRILDDLTAAVRDHGDPAAREAMTVLENWDRQTEATSRGAVLFLHLVRRFGFGPFATPWSADQPLTTPDGLADPALTAKRLAEAAAEVRRLHGSLDIAWGDVYRVRHDDLDLPANGGPGALGIFRNVEYRPDPDGRQRAIGGDSFVMVVQFSDPVRAQAILPYGNATQKHSPHRGDQFRLFAEKKLRPVWRTREEIESHLESRDAWQQLPVRKEN